MSEPLKKSAAPARSESARSEPVRSEPARREAQRAASLAKGEGFAVLLARGAGQQAASSVARPAQADVRTTPEPRDAESKLSAAHERRHDATDPTSDAMALAPQSRELELLAASAASSVGIDLHTQPQTYLHGLSEIVEFAVLVKDARGVHHLQLGVTSSGAGAQTSYDVQLAALGNGRIALRVRGVGAKDRAALDAHRELAQRLRERGLEVVEDEESD